ncbi:single-stranded DNA-binding protein [Sulfuracidifex metallicus]|uniref:single-stranded DNA-binding protein n=1 Tax=Sulfuracidifex metallicus TaxID=47303 RepID=UPI002273C992|nr:single-stranded DNA-binding protein [Sulfuracidifex metallicus]MCY0849703.1 single-stranded DNA-binding protein [Sulfuracidifex metallicus]
MKVSELKPRASATVTVKVVKLGEPKQVTNKDGSLHKVSDVLVGDETGSILMSLWDDNISKVNENDVIEVNNGYVSVVRGSMRLTLGREGKMEKSSQNIENVNTEKNLSDQKIEDSGYRGGYRRSFNRRY